MSRVSSYGERPSDPNRKYGRNHWHGCMCTDCLDTFDAHNTRMAHCPCEDCVRTRAALRKAKENNAEILPPPIERESAPVSTVNLCDRCGTMGKSQTMGTVVIVPVNDKADVYGDAVRTTGPANATHRMEVCPGCVGEIMEWKDVEVPATNRPRAYNEPWTAERKVPDLSALSDLVNMDSATLTRLAIEAGRRELADEPPQSSD